MKKYLTILAVISLFATCKKTVGTLDGSKSKNCDRYFWRQVSGQQTIIDNPNNKVTTFQAGYVGKYVFRLTGYFGKDSLSDDVIKTIKK